MFKTNKDGTPRTPLKNRHSDDTLVLADGKSGTWTPHDLRRTGATMMQALGISLELIDRCQNHLLPVSKVRRHYMLYDYADEKRAAWAALGEQLTTVLGSKLSPAREHQAGGIEATSTPHTVRPIVPGFP